MRRRVLHDASAAATRAAALLLREDFDVGPLSPDGSVDPSEDAVLLAGGPVDVPPAPTVRVIGLGDATDSVRSDSWYLLLPADVSAAALVRAMRAAFADLDAVTEIARLGHELAELNVIGARLSSERDPRALLELVLTTAREITHSDAGSLYLVEPGPDGTPHLRFALAQNDSVPVTFQTTTLPLSRESLAGWVALEGRTLTLDDAYTAPSDAPFRINRAFDRSSGYRTKSMLVVPMRTTRGETIGAVQLINCKPDFATRLTSIETIERLVVPFSPRFVALASSLASQAAVALANSRLYDAIRQLFDGFVRAAVLAIESRDPTTAGHSFRVADLTVGLAQAADRCARGPYAGFRLQGDDALELRYASLLHDFGKVGVREHVLVKARKLAPATLERIRHRVDRLRLTHEIRALQRKLAHVLEKGPTQYEPHAALVDAEMQATLADLDQALRRVDRANQPSVIAATAAADVRWLLEHLFEDDDGVRNPVVTRSEAENLSITQGSLTAEEYRQIRAHVEHTWEFLAQIPWTREFARIPEIAHAHHEKLDGSGYPRGLAAPDIPVQSRMMAITDIYDALTAFDRPYKPALSPELALDILHAERRAGRLDGDLLELFVDARVWEVTRRDRPG